MIPVLGLAGVAGAGKDTVFDRIAALDHRFRRLSVADPLKASVAALLGITVEQLEELKRDETSFVDVGGDSGQLMSTMSIRTFLQRYGTEAHRDIFGEDFWLDAWEAEARKVHDAHPGAVIVNTSVRFPNEALRIIEMGGQVWHVDGPQDPGAAGHESDDPLPSELITGVIDNTVRTMLERRADDGSIDCIEPDYTALDDQIALLLSGLS